LKAFLILPYLIEAVGDHTQMLRVYPNVFNFTQKLHEVLVWSKFDESCWNYQMIPVHKAVSILPS